MSTTTETETDTAAFVATKKEAKAAKAAAKAAAAAASTPEVTNAPVARVTTWRERVTIEADDLQEKLTKLKLFMTTPEYANMDSTVRHLMRRQDIHMAGYLAALRKRLELAGA